MKEKNVKTKTPNKKALGLTTKIFIALLAGAILGIVLCYLVPDSSFKKDVIVEGILYVIGSIGAAREPKCIEAGCDNKQASGSSYCYLHKFCTYFFEMVEIFAKRRRLMYNKDTQS